VTLLTTGIPITLMTGWDLRLVILGVGVFTALYTMIGGIEAVVWTDVAQGMLLILGAVVIVLRLIFATEVGPPGAVIGEAWAQGRFALGSFDLSWDSLLDTATPTQWLLILAMTVGWARRYVCDQHMVQRYLIAGSDRQARRGVMVNAAMCVPLYATFMFIGACLFGYYALSSGPEPRLADNAMPFFIVHELPSGVIGLILAAVLAASMSSISSDLNSVATVLTTDYFVNFLPNVSDRARVLFGRLMVIAGGTAAALIAFAMIPESGSASIMERGVTIAAIVSGGMLGLFLLGFLTRRATRRGCYVGIAACLLFTAWGITTEPTHRLVDMGLNFPFNPILIGVLGHVVLFVTGYVASIVLGGYCPADVDRLTVRSFRRGKRLQAPQMEPEAA
jgi:SSS family solute:Na+ symporter